MFRPGILEARFPSIHSIAKRGITLTNFHVTSPLCGPSRACLLRGQYAHAINHRTNDATSVRSRGFGGDFATFVEKGYFDDDMGKWMKDAGYHTVFVGKYINYVEMPSRLPAGWDDYYRSHGSAYYSTSRFTNRDNAEGAFSPIPEGEYRTNIEADDVVRLINKHGPGDKPLFVYFAPFGPHDEGKAPGGMIDTEDADLWPELSQIELADFDEADVSDKPPAYSQLPPLSEELKERIGEIYRERMLSVKSVDRAVNRIVTALADIGELENTYIFITSDNGFSLGQHRMIAKGHSLTRATHVPLIVCGPGIEPEQKANHLLAHIDLAPTFVEIAGAEQKEFFDGKSILPVLQNPADHAEKDWRNFVLIENWQSKIYMGARLNTTYSQLRLYDSTYTEWADGSREFYDLNLDPLELDNAFVAMPDDQKQDLSARMRIARHDMAYPLVTLENPFEDDGQIAGPPFALRGVAEDSLGVKRVQLVIRNRTTQEYWNGKAWQTKRFVLPTELKNPNGIQAEWSYSFEPPRPEKMAERYTVIPRARAIDSRYTLNVPKRHFDYDPFPPTTVINNLRFPISGKVRIIGRARDNQEVEHVRIHLFDQTSLKYFNGEEWVSKNEFFLLETDEQDKWEVITPKLKPGRYVVRARAYDTAGNWDDTPAVKIFTVD